MIICIITLPSAFQIAAQDSQQNKGKEDSDHNLIRPSKISFQRTLNFPQYLICKTSFGPMSNIHTIFFFALNSKLIELKLLALENI